MRDFNVRSGLVVALGLIVTSAATAVEPPWPQGLQRLDQRAAVGLPLARSGGRATADIVLLADGELLRNAADWLAGFVRRETGAAVRIGGAEQLKPGRAHLVAAVGDSHPLIRRLAAAGKLQLEPRVGPQGFVLERASDEEAGELLVSWSPAELGCRYGLIEVLRSLRLVGQSLDTNLGHVVDRPQFPVRICYVNSGEHLQNAFNPNFLFDTPVNRWSTADWERLIDMISAFRYNVFEFWLVPTLFSPDALRGGKIQVEFARVMSHVIAYAKRRGVTVHPIQAVNTVGREWQCLCPNDPQQRAEIVALWDHWARALEGLESIGFFPGDPGGCYRNGCTAETFVDLCLELSKVLRKCHPKLRIEVNTWGEPMGGWGVPLWTGKPDRAEKAMRYLLAKLPQFPADTLTSINLGFSPDCYPNSHGGDGRPYAQQAAQTNPVLTWDYSVTEGEGTVSPRCRVRRMFLRRREESALGCYSGGICYTMAPKLNCASIFACAESYWNPAARPEAVLADFGRLVFGDELAAIGPLIEEFEVVPDWGYYPPFPYSPRRLRLAMARLRPLLERVDANARPRLPLAPTMAEYGRSLMFYADLFEKLSTVALTLDELKAAAVASGKVPAGRQELVSLDEAEQLLADPAEFPGRPKLSRLAARLRQLDVRRLIKRYWNTVYGIYDVIPHPVDPRAQGATAVLFQRFNCPDAMVHEPTPLEKTLRRSGKPFLLVSFGLPAGERGWTLGGWTVDGEDAGESWRASFDEPGILARNDFRDQGYRWLVVRLTEGPCGGRKAMAVNGKRVGEFVRTGPPVSVRKEWWVTRSYPIPQGLLKPGKLEIRFTGPGIAVSGVALAVDRVPDTR
jgi:hypothetical protein